MTSTFADKLLAAADDANLPPHELRALLRRAALRLRELAPADGEDHVGLIDDARADAGKSQHNHDASRQAWKEAAPEKKPRK